MRTFIQKNKKILHGLFLFSILGMSFGVTGVGFAQTPVQTTVTADKYVVLAPLPGTTEGDCTTTGCKSGLEEYLPGLFKLSIGVGAVTAFIMLTIYGFEYMLTDSLGTKTNSKKRILDAVWGLGIVIFAYAILNTLNPALVAGNLNIPSPQIPVADVIAVASSTRSAGNIAGTPMTAEAIKASNDVRTGLENAAKITTYAGPCTQGQTTGCVNLNGLSKNAWDGLVDISKYCGVGCLVITGGTEAGHSETGGHPFGQSVDLKPTPKLDAFMQSIGIPAKVTPSPLQVNIHGKPAVVWYEQEGTGGTSSGVHWHVQFK